MTRENVTPARIQSRVWQSRGRVVRHAGVNCETFADGVTIEVHNDDDYEADAMMDRSLSLSLATDATVSVNPVICDSVMYTLTRSINSNDKLRLLSSAISLSRQNGERSLSDAIRYRYRFSVDQHGIDPDGIARHQH